MRLPTYSFGDDQLADALATLLSDETIRTRAAAAGARLRRRSGTAMAADLIERLVDTGEPVHRDG